MWEQILRIDSDVLVFLNSFHTDVLDVAMYQLTLLWTWIPVLLLLFWVFWKHYRKRTWLIAAFLALAIVFSDRSSNIIKQTVKRPRPTHNEMISDKLHLHQHADGTPYKGGAYGFVSSHAANSFALIVLLMYCFAPIDRRIRWIFPCFALLFAYTRIYLGVHYPLDILCGALLGLLCGGFALWLYRMAVKQIEKLSEQK
jgi:undecaprenyl-diphosphatase